MVIVDDWLLLYLLDLDHTCVKLYVQTSVMEGESDTACVASFQTCGSTVLETCGIFILCKLQNIM